MEYLLMAKIEWVKLKEFCLKENIQYTPLEHNLLTPIWQTLTTEDQRILQLSYNLVCYLLGQEVLATECSI